MMNYELFKKNVEEKFLDYMPDDFKNYKVNIHPVIKTNQTLDALTLLPETAGPRDISPTIYINEMYERYQHSEDLRQELEMAAFDMVKAFQDISEKITNLDYKDVKDNVVMALINTEQNQELLSDVPHRNYHDLSIIYRWIIDDTNKEFANCIIKHSLMETLEMTEAVLYRAAVINTERLFPPVVRGMKDVMLELVKKIGESDEFLDEMVENMPPEKRMYIIGNERGIHGAAAILYESFLHKLSESLETDLYLLPCSVHEWIAVSADGNDPYELANMVAGINQASVALDERLSNQVYYYDKDLRSISLATDTPNKRLDE